MSPEEEFFSGYIEAVKELEEMVNNTADAEEITYEQALATLANMILVLMDKPVHIHPILQDYDTIRDLYHGRMTLDEL
ncbi:MAG TPA: hypothetical protein PKD68_00425 [Candidatus Saccharibacteria bacterium]|nr:hypothetical protein [Candidatus Saccharibacteria bacterium]